MLGAPGVVAVVAAALPAGAVIAFPTQDSSQTVEDRVGAYLGLVAMFWVPLGDGAAAARPRRPARETTGGSAAA